MFVARQVFVFCRLSRRWNVLNRLSDLSWASISSWQVCVCVCVCVCAVYMDSQSRDNWARSVYNGPGCYKRQKNRSCNVFAKEYSKVLQLPVEYIIINSPKTLTKNIPGIFVRPADVTDLTLYIKQPPCSENFKTVPRKIFLIKIH